MDEAIGAIIGLLVIVLLFVGGGCLVINDADWFYVETYHGGYCVMIHSFGRSQIMRDEMTAEQATNLANRLNKELPPYGHKKEAK